MGIFAFKSARLYSVMGVGSWIIFADLNADKVINRYHHDEGAEI
jgi:hypothetical protein